MADTGALRAPVRKGVRVRLSPAAQKEIIYLHPYKFVKKVYATHPTCPLNVIFHNCKTWLNMK